MCSNPAAPNMQLSESWPELDVSLWKKARMPASVLDEGGRAAKWRLETVRLRTAAHSSWLIWLEERDQLSLTEGPVLSENHIRA
jgi:hypothetical protein